ncbi:uncharacterized protein LOC141720622 [Apium graveolens]|uniref:uncharacterized protein LOC141720622 n=1 Tax=Apium graveolens TaxID=4045 RepID=UPI003D7BC4F9
MVYMKLGIEEEEEEEEAATDNRDRLIVEDELASSSSCSSSPISLGGRAIDRCNPIIRDASRLGKVVQLNTTGTKPPSSPHQPTTDPKHDIIKSMINIRQTKKKKTSMLSSLKKEKKTTSIADCADKLVNKTKTSSEPATDSKEIIINSPGDSSRYLLTTANSSSTHEMKSFIYSHRFDPHLALVEQSSCTSSFSSSQFTSSPASAASNCQHYLQVVVLRVSLHCRGCERKMRKHISKMEGVTSFNIDFAAKKLTVVGNVTPLSVLASVSKVKKAQLLTSPAPITSSSTIPSCSNDTISTISKDKAILV